MLKSDLNNIVNINKTIIKSLKEQKLKNDTFLEGYEEEIKNELKDPMNALMQWSRRVNPYMNSVALSQALEVNINQQYDHFVDELIRYNAQAMITQGEINETEFIFDTMVGIIMRLETKFDQMKQGGFVGKRPIINRTIETMPGIGELKEEEDPFKSFTVEHVEQVLLLTKEVVNEAKKLYYQVGKLDLVPINKIRMACCIFITARLSDCQISMNRVAQTVSCSQASVFKYTTRIVQQLNIKGVFGPPVFPELMKKNAEKKEAEENTEKVEIEENNEQIETK